MAKPTIANNFQRLSFQGLYDFVTIVLASMTGNPSYTTPNPTLISLGTLATALNDAIVAWGPVGNRGSHAQYVALQLAAKNMKQGMVQLAEYCMNTTPYNLAALSTSGFVLRNTNTPQGVLQAPVGAHRSIVPTLTIRQNKILWKKPLGVTINGNVKVWNIYRGVTPIFADAALIGSSTKRSFVDEPNITTPVPNYVYYWVAGVNNQGVGVPSDVVQVNYIP